MTCVITGCGRPVHVVGRGLCAAHYLRWRVHGDVQADIPVQTRNPQTWRCRVRGCFHPPCARNLCRLHYERWHQWRKDGPKCILDGCDRPVKANGICHRHYMQDWRRDRHARELDQGTRERDAG